MAPSWWDIFRSPLGLFGIAGVGCIAGYLAGIAAGLRHLHGCGVVHVDLSLKSVLVAEHHCAKLGDYGAAHSAQSFLGSLPVTTGYARAPEQWAGSPVVDTGADAWSLGVITLAMCTGECPFLPGEAEDQVFPAMVALLGTVTEANWPGHGSLPQWGKLVQYNKLAQGRGVDAWVAARPVARPLGSGHPTIA